MTTKGFLKGLIYFSLAIIPFLAWYVSDSTFFPFITGKNFAFRTLVEIAFASWLILAYLEPAYRPKKSIVFYTYAFFLIAIMISNFLGSNPYLSFFSNYERMEGWFTHLHLFIYFAILYSVYKTEKDWTKMFGWFSVSAVVVMTEGLFQLFGQKDFFMTQFFTSNFLEKLNTAYPTHMGGGLRIDSSLGNAAYYGIYTLFFVFIGALIAFKVNKWKGKQNFWPLLLLVLGTFLILIKNVILVYANSIVATNMSLASTMSSLSSFLWFIGWIVVLFSGVNFVRSLNRGEMGSWPFVVISFVALVSLAYTQTRGSYFGLIGGMVVAGLLYVFNSKGGKNTKTIKVSIISLIVATVTAFALIFTFKDSSVVKNNVVFSRIATIKMANIIAHPINSYNMVANESNDYKKLLDYFGEVTIVSRFLNAKISIDGVTENAKSLLLGYGQENYPTVFASHYDPRMYMQETWFDRAHNVFMDWLVAGGVIGLIAYLALYLTSIYMLWFAKGRTNIDIVERSLLTGMLVAYFIHNVFVFDNLISYILFVLVLAYIAARTRDTESHIKEEGKIHEKHNPMIISTISGIAVAFSLVMFIFVVWKPLSANMELINAIRVFPTNYSGIATSTEASYNKFVNALDKNSFGNMEIKEQMLQKSLVLSQVDTKGLEEPIKNSFAKISDKFIELSENNMIQAMKNTPNVRDLALLGSYFVQKGKLDEGLAYLKQAYDVNTQKQAVAFEYIRALIAKADIASALKVAETTYNGDKTYEEAKNIYDLVLKESKK